MNNELKELNKKIRLLNDVMQLKALFTNDKSQNFYKQRAEQTLSDMLKKARKHVINDHELIIFFVMKNIINVANDLRTLMGNKEVVIKRKVVNDKLISVYVQEPTTKETMPLNPDAFIKMIEKIKLQ